MERIVFDEEQEIFVAMQSDKMKVRLLLQQGEHDVIVKLGLMQLKVLTDSLNSLLYYQSINCLIDDQAGSENGAMTIISVFPNENLKGEWNECRQQPSSVQTDKQSRFKSA